MTRRDSNPRPHGRTALSVVCVALVLLFFGGLEEGGLRLGGHAAVAQFGGGLLGALKCGTIGDKTGEGRCGPDTRSANPGQQDPCKACNKKADKLRDDWIDFKKRWDAHNKKLEDEGTYQGTDKYKEDQTHKDLWEEKNQLRRDWEDHSDACFSSEPRCYIGKINKKRPVRRGGVSSPAPSSTPQSKPSATPEADGKPPRDKYESCGQIDDPKYGEDDEYLDWWVFYCS